MLTVDIPQSTSRISEEDKFAKYILKGISEDGQKRFLHYGCGWGNGWKEGYSDSPTSETVLISHDAFCNVIEAFRKKGYSIIRLEQIAAGTYYLIK